MGGHGHAHDSVKIPSPDSYKIEDYPMAVKFQERLAKEGLKDPWLRNELWRLHPKFKTKGQRAMMLCFRGWKLGVPAFLITIGIEEFLRQGKKDQHGHDSHH